MHMQLLSMQAVFVYMQLIDARSHACSTPHARICMHTGIQLLRSNIRNELALFEELMLKADSGHVFASLVENKAGVTKAAGAMSQSTIYAIWAYRQCARQVICMHACMHIYICILLAARTA